MKTKFLMGLVIAVFAGFFVLMSVRTGPWAFDETAEQSFELQQLKNTRRMNESKMAKLQDVRVTALAREKQLLALLHQHRAATVEPDKVAEYDAMIQKIQERMAVLERGNNEIYAE